MGNAESNESAAVKRQAEGFSNPMYRLLDLGVSFDLLILLFGSVRSSRNANLRLFVCSSVRLKQSVLQLIISIFWDQIISR